MVKAEDHFVCSKPHVSAVFSGSFVSHGSFRRQSPVNAHKRTEQRGDLCDKLFKRHMSQAHQYVLSPIRNPVPFHDPEHLLSGIFDECRITSLHTQFEQRVHLTSS
ncbi:hypothetical protein AVEN_171779-1 [Araneus ventricosus]|uniref:Uncharacterized protein n=1 Tax=Araneus ventricosus TaxID=182803 RepID=A0A4Y2R533_ARAVE|nr:hypothetical protein AVEN_171779-1 [Araneus ventricosus]